MVQVDGASRFVAIIGFDDMPMAGSPLVGLTPSRQPVEAMARTAARRLVERIRVGGMGTPVHDVRPIQLVRRDTTGAATSSPA